MAKRKTNKSELIRQELAKHPEKSVQDLAKALKVDASLVYQVKSQLKAKAEVPNAPKENAERRFRVRRPMAACRASLLRPNSSSPVAALRRHAKLSRRRSKLSPR